MPPILALLACLAFCFYAIRQENRWSSSVSSALWIPTLWVMRCGSRSLDNWFESGGGDDAALEGTIVDPLFVAAMMLIGVIILTGRKSKSIAVLRGEFWLVVFYAYMALSVLWADPAWVAFKRYSRTFGDLLMVVIVMTEVNPLQALATVVRRTLIVLLPLSAVLAKYYGPLGRMHEKGGASDTWIGVTTHKNSLGQLCAIATLYFVWNYFLGRKDRNSPAFAGWLTGRLYWFFAALTIYLLNPGGYSSSATATVITAIAIGLYFLMERYRNNLRQLFTILFTGGISYLVLNIASELIAGQSLYVTLLTLLGKDPSLTDRTLLWADLQQFGQKNLLLGKGYMAFWSPETIQSLYDIGWTWRPEQAHSGYMETFLHLGLVGLTLLLIVIVVSLVRSIRVCSTSFEEGRLRLLLLLMAVVGNVSESGFGRPMNLLFITFLLAVTGLGQRLALDASSKRPSTSNPSPLPA